MKRVLPVIIFFVVLSNILHQSYAQYTKPVGKLQTQVSASVGEFYLSVSGFIAPYASVVLYSKEGILLRSGVADGSGTFYISQVLIKRGFSGFCLVAVDYKRLGESTTCVDVPPAQASITMNDLFLPPTLGLFRSEVAAGATVIAFGYTMPWANVTLKLNNGTTLTTIADSTGYYEFRIGGLKPGTYQLVADAVYKGEQSLKPTKAIILKALSLWEQFMVFLKSLLQKLLDFFTSWKLGPLWAAVPILILIIILILRLWPERFTFIYNNRMMVFFSRRRPKKLHHYWFIGY